MHVFQMPVLLLSPFKIFQAILLLLFIGKLLVGLFAYITCWISIHLLHGQFYLEVICGDCGYSNYE